MSFERVAASMILFKTIEMNLKAGAAECSLVLKEFVKKIGMYGRRYANILAKVLDSTGDSYAVEIIKEFSIFDSYRVKLFKHRIENMESSMFSSTLSLTSRRIYWSPNLRGSKKTKANSSNFSTNTKKSTTLTPTSITWNKIKKTFSWSSNQPLRAKRLKSSRDTLRTLPQKAMCFWRKSSLFGQF